MDYSLKQAVGEWEEKKEEEAEARGEVILNRANGNLIPWEEKMCNNMMMRLRRQLLSAGRKRGRSDS